MVIEGALLGGGEMLVPPEDQDATVFGGFLKNIPFMTFFLFPL
jgi:hypothetical protein